MRIGRILGLVAATAVLIGIIIGFYWLLAIALVKVFPGLAGKEFWVFLIVAIVLNCIDRGK